MVTRRLLDSPLFQKYFTDAELPSPGREGRMSLSRIVVAMDNSSTAMHAGTIAVILAKSAEAELVALTVAEPGHREQDPVLIQSLERKLGSIIHQQGNHVTPMASVAHGLPQIEICRFSEQRRADLVVLGRKHRSRATRLFLGDTADAVVRRSRIPCMLVPETTERLSRILVAVDGTARGFMVYRCALALAEATGLEIEAVTVEAEFPGEPRDLALQVPTTRTQLLARKIERTLGAARLAAYRGRKIPELRVSRGPVELAILEALEQCRADVLVLGFHRGGPALVVENTSICRHLLHSAPTAVVTVPF